MPFYLVNYRANIYLGNQLCNFLIKEDISIPINALLSSDNIYLRDSGGIYLTCLNDETTYITFYTNDNEMLVDSNNKILVYERRE